MKIRENFHFNSSRHCKPFTSPNPWELETCLFFFNNSNILKILHKVLVYVSETSLCALRHNYNHADYSSAGPWIWGWPTHAGESRGNKLIEWNAIRQSWEVSDTNAPPDKNQPTNRRLMQWWERFCAHSYLLMASYTICRQPLTKKSIQKCIHPLQLTLEWRSSFHHFTLPHM